jgi:hypothetical protein
VILGPPLGFADLAVWVEGGSIAEQRATASNGAEARLQGKERIADEDGGS